MHTEPQIGSVLAGLRRRQRMLNVVQFGLHGLLAGAAAGCAGAVIAWSIWHPGTMNLVLVALACTAAGLFVAMAIGATLPIGDLELARALDRAASSEDRFASAMQLADHHRRSRAGLVIEDAMSRVGGVSAAAALPVIVPRSAKWLPVPVVALAALLAILPAASQTATAAHAPEISTDEWSAINKDFAKELAQLPKPMTKDEEELQEQLKKLSEMLKQNPEKRDALREIARLSDRIAERRKAMGVRRSSMKNAAKAMSSSTALRDFASSLKQGAYEQAASDLKKLSDKLKNGEMNLDASEFEAMASDLQKMAEQASEEKEMQQECQNSANAASSMNREQLAEALKRLSEQMKKNSEKMGQCDRMGQCDDMLEQLRRMMNQCNGQCQNPGEGFCDNEGQGGGKGGQKAGWGSAAKWTGGGLKPADEGRTPDIENPAERAGMNSTFQTVSPEERARSGKKYEELYAEFVQKSEADLDLESVPVAYREFLKRYFNAIKPEEAPAEKSGGN